MVDGGGGPPFPRPRRPGGRIEVLTEGRRRRRRPAHRRLRQVVCPGFIDLHSHSGLTIFAEPLHEPKVRQGVTTEVIGVDGTVVCPLPDPADLEALSRINAGLDGVPDVARLATVE